MNYKILIAALCLGILIGLAITGTTPHTTGAVVTCYAENQPCVCDEIECRCGELVLPVSYCINDIKDQSKILS